MGATSTYELPYPEAADAPNGPTQIQSLAQAIETELTRIDSAADDLDTDLTNLTNLTNSRPRGLVKWAQRTTPSPTTTAADLGVLRLDNIPMVGGRQYRIWTSPLPLDSTVTNDEIRARIRISTAGAATIANNAVPGATVHTRQTDANVSEDKAMSVTYRPTGDQTVSLLLCVGRIAGTGNVSLNNSDDEETVQLVVEDIGLAQEQSGITI
ncbi:hypothetical protein ACIBF5_09470 [Micromonospora sp. NPDC050417]|uniref:hypothetical protein n=1 Tax=Micromonospora sp. NPDC050417 TaxID=3364280 RepID=UPI00379DA3FD